MNSKIIKTLFTATFFVLLTGNSLAQEKPMPRDIQWVTKSIEYAALCEQIFRNAWPIVKERAQAEQEKWVVSFDVDETVLDNSPYAVERAKIDSGFTSKSWSEWVRRESAQPVPGAKAFIDSLRGLGLHIAFITNRNIKNEAPTIANLKKVGLYQNGDPVLTRINREDKKSARRKCLEEGTGRCEKTGPLTILALFGDNIRDFIPMNGMETARDYRENLLPKDENWGVKYFMLPNPNYGSWERDYK